MGTPKMVASPKAVAAQTYKSRGCATTFWNCGAWALYADIFSVQFKSEAVECGMKEMPGDWVAYPFSIVNHIDQRCCLVWIEAGNDRIYVRHVRLYNNIVSAEIDNKRIKETILKLT